MNNGVIHTVGRGSFWVSSSTLILKAVGLVTVAVMLWRLGAGEYGVLELSLSLVSLFSIFMLPGLDSLLVADMGSEKGRGEGSRARRILEAFVLLQSVLAMCAFAVAFVGAGWFAELYRVPRIYIELVSLTFLPGPVRAAYAVLFRVQLQFFLQSLLTIIEEVFKLGSLLVYFFVFNLHIGGVILSILTSQTLTLLILSPWFIRGVKSLRGGDNVGKLGFFELLYGHGYWSVLTSYISNVGSAARLWIIQRLLGPSAVGLYAVASGLIGHTTSLVPFSTVMSSVLPQYVHDKARFIKLLFKAIEYQLIANAALFVVAFAVFPPVLSLIFPQYHDAFPLFRGMLLGLFSGGVIGMLTPAFFALKEQRNLFLSMLFKSIMTVIFAYVGILLFGIWGLVVESVLTSLIQAFERVRRLRRITPEFPHFGWRMFAFDEDDRIVLDTVQKTLGRWTAFMR